LSPGAPLDELSREELIALIVELRGEVERLKREQRRQAAPFSKQQPKANPKTPGRKPGQGLFTRPGDAGPGRDGDRDSPSSAVLSAVWRATGMDRRGMRLHRQIGGAGHGLILEARHLKNVL
jgi:hypothetical protein